MERKRDENSYDLAIFHQGRFPFFSSTKEDFLFSVFLNPECGGWDRAVCGLFTQKLDAFADTLGRTSVLRGHWKPGMTGRGAGLLLIVPAPGGVQEHRKPSQLRAPYYRLPDIGEPCGYGFLCQVPVLPFYPHVGT